MSVANKKLISEFESYISAIKGLLKNTVLAYTRDIKIFLDYIEKRQLPLNKIKQDDINEYLWKRKNEELFSKSIYGNMESIRQFFKFLILEHDLENDPKVKG